MGLIDTQDFKRSQAEENLIRLNEKLSRELERVDNIMKQIRVQRRALAKLDNPPLEIINKLDELSSAGEASFRTVTQIENELDEQEEKAQREQAERDEAKAKKIAAREAARSPQKNQ